MKPFLLFFGDLNYPKGGWGDFHDSYDTLDEALAEVPPDAEWYHVVHSPEESIIIKS